jgi:integrase
VQVAVLERATRPKREEKEMTTRGQGRVFTRKGSPFFWISYYSRGEEQREVARHVRTGKKLETTEANQHEAERFLKHRRGEVTAEKHGGPVFVGPSQQRVLVNEILDDLITEYKLGGKRGIPREVNAQMKSHIKSVRDYFGSTCAIVVRKSHLQKFIDVLKGEKKRNATINRRLQLLGQAYAIAVAADPPKLPRALKVPKLDESDNVRKGKFSKTEASLVAGSLPLYLADVARFAYETGARVGEILKLRWGYLDGDAISVPATDTKNRELRSIVLTPELDAIIARRRAARVEGCELIFHHSGHAIVDYRKCWQTACVTNGLGRFLCRECKDEQGHYASVLDADHKCPQCGKKCERPKYIGKLVHDFRRSAAHELWKAGNTVEDCMEVTGHKTTAMFKRYADLFTEEEKRARQRHVQQRRSEWREAQLDNVVVMPTAMHQ